MNTQPLVSIIIPARNAVSVLPDALRSVLQQTYARWEALVVDDGSIDGTAQVAQKFITADSRFRLIAQPHGGVSNARNAALRSASGELIAFLDADDVWLPEKLARQIRFFSEGRRADFAFTNYWYWDGASTMGARYVKRHRFPEGDPFYGLVRANVYCTSTVVVSREALGRVGEFDTTLSIGEDWDLWLRLAETGIRAAGEWEPMARYRFWPHNATRVQLKVAEANVRVLEQRWSGCASAAGRRLYQYSLAAARANREIAQTINQPLTTRHSLALATCRAWRLNPREIKWLFRSLGLFLPNWLGGRTVARKIQRRIQEKWGGGVTD